MGRLRKWVLQDISNIMVAGQWYRSLFSTTKKSQLLQKYLRDFRRTKSINLWLSYQIYKLMLLLINTIIGIIEQSKQNLLMSIRC